MVYGRECEENKVRDDAESQNREDELDRWATVLNGLGVFQMRSAFPPDEPVARPIIRMALWLLLVAFICRGLAILVFARAGKLSRHFVTDPEDAVSLSGPVSEAWLVAAFQCLGVYAIMTWLPALVQVAVRCWIYGTWTEPKTPLLQSFYMNWSNLICPFIGALSGVLFVFRWGGLFRLIRRTRG